MEPMEELENDSLWAAMIHRCFPGNCPYFSEIPGKGRMPNPPEDIYVE